MSRDPAQPLEAPRPPADLNPRREPVLDFPDRDFGELTAKDYDVLGFMAGLEVHQQLRTTSKLFCRCPAGVKASQVDAEVLRHMRPTLSELGEYDGTALMEFKTNKEIVYRLDRNTVCTYEIDDTPPFRIDAEAVRYALEVCRLLRLNLVSELHVMRKQYLDGSIPTGFQRTAMVGLGGEIPFLGSELGRSRTLRIRQLSLEEDSCREVSDIGHRIVFQPDRLGIPLIETVTEPDLLTPLDVMAGGRQLAEVARATGRVRRGPGAARQDVNVSVAGGRRVEIKGVDNHRILPQLVHIEAYRQLNLLRIKAELERRGVTREMFTIPDAGPQRTPPWEQTELVIDARRTLRRANYPPLNECLDAGGAVCAVRVPGFRSLLTHRTQPGITFAREIEGRLRVIACLTATPCMIHSDVEDYGLAASIWRQLRHALRADSGDAVFVLWGDQQDAATGAREVLIRAAEALDGVPSETRQAFRDGTTGFERILPGPDRMYPDTDTPPVPIPDLWVAEAEAALPESPWSRHRRFVDCGLDDDLARRTAYAPWAELFDTLVANGDPRPSAETARRIAWALLKRLRRAWRRRRSRELPDAERLRPLVAAIEDGSMLPGGLEPALDALLLEPELDPGQLLESRATGPAALALLEELVDKASANLVGVRARDARAVMRWAMGQVMPVLAGRVDPHVVEEAVAERLEILE